MFTTETNRETTFWLDVRWPPIRDSPETTNLWPITHVDLVYALFTTDGFPITLHNYPLADRSYANVLLFIVRLYTLEISPGIFLKVKDKLCPACNKT
jgi:hypothetical protein